MNNIDRKNKPIKPQHKSNDEDFQITDKDFYPPEDTRLYCSGIDDIPNGDNFNEYSKWFFDNYENEIFDT